MKKVKIFIVIIAITFMIILIGFNNISKPVSKDITEKEMEAIKAHAISSSTINSIINNTDKDKLRALVTPDNNKALNASRVSYIKQLDSTGYTLSEIADKMGISVSTVSKYINE